MSDQPEKPPHISQKDWDDADIPELTDGDFARMVPFRDAHPETFAVWKRGRGRPAVDAPKVHFAIRMDPATIERIKATGKGYSARVESVLRKALAAGELEPPRDLRGEPKR